MKVAYRHGWIVVPLLGFVVVSGCDSKSSDKAETPSAPLGHSSQAGMASLQTPMVPMTIPVTPELAPRPTYTVYRGSPQEIQAVQADARRWNDAFYAGDFATLLGLQHPSVVDKTGGDALAIEKMRQVHAEVVARGLRVESFEFPTDPTFLKTTVREYVLVPTLRVVTNGTVRVENKNFQFGAREIGNPTWTYIDGAQLSAARIHALFPDLPSNFQVMEVSGRQLR